MKILGVETSCDETSASIITAEKNDKNVKTLSNVISSSLSLHSKTGGIIPEIAAREQLKYILPVIEKALYKAKTKMEEIDVIAVTIGPGLIGSLLVGIETAKTISMLYKKPIIPVNHLYGHIYANFVRRIEDRESKIENRSVSFPAVCLVVSGGHTDLVFIKKHGEIKWLGGTKDDAAGEAFDKIGRLLNLPYPGGPSIEKAAKNGDPDSFDLPRPMISSKDFDFSFSGLKTAVLKEIKAMKQPASPTGGLSNETINNFAASTQQSIIDVLIKKTIKAAIKYKVKSILLSGGVAANQKLRDAFEAEIKNLKLKAKLFVPDKKLCTDNAAMIAAAAFFNQNKVEWKKITVNPELYFY